MTRIGVSISLPEEVYKKLVEVEATAKRESRSWSRSAFLTPLIEKALQDYKKIHGDGNPAFGLDHWYGNPEMMATPALFRDRRTIEKYLQKVSKTERVKIYGKIRQWEEILRRTEVYS